MIEMIDAKMFTVVLSKKMPVQTRLSPQMQTMREISLIEGPKPGDVEATRTEKPAPRLIAHLDMDAFFASVELLRFPQLQGLALVVGGRSKTIMQQMQQLQAQYGALESIAVAQMPRLRQYQGRGVITTASYAARAFGIGSGMGLMKAATRCPDAILLAADFERYREYSRRFKAVIRDQGLSLEDRGIDEVYIDLSHCASLEQAQALSRQLQSSIFEATRLSCSIGLAPNKLLAKIASDLRKPKGLSILTHASIEEQLWPLPVSRLHGVGPRTATKLLALGINTIAELAASRLDDLQRHFGSSHSRWLIDASWGIDERPLVLSSEPLSISRETTLERDMHPKQDRRELGGIFTQLCHQLATDLQHKERLCRAISVKIRNDQFKTSTRDVSFAQATNDPAQLRYWASQCLKRFPFDRRIRLLGVKAAGLTSKQLVTASPVGPKSDPHCEGMHSESLVTNGLEQSQPSAPVQHPLWPELEPEPTTPEV